MTISLPRPLFTFSGPPSMYVASEISWVRVAKQLKACCVSRTTCPCTLFNLPYYFDRTFNNYTGRQSVSAVLLWQPSVCTDLFVIDYIFVLFSENKYDDDDATTENLSFECQHLSLSTERSRQYFSDHVDCLVDVSRRWRPADPVLWDWTSRSHWNLPQCTDYNTVQCRTDGTVRSKV